MIGNNIGVRMFISCSLVVTLNITCSEVKKISTSTSDITSDITEKSNLSSNNFNADCFAINKDDSLHICLLRSVIDQHNTKWLPSFDSIIAHTYSLKFLLDKNTNYAVNGNPNAERNILDFYNSINFEGYASLDYQRANTLDHNIEQHLCSLPNNKKYKLLVDLLDKGECYEQTATKHRAHNHPTVILSERIYRSCIVPWFQSNSDLPNSYSYQLPGYIFYKYYSDSSLSDCESNKLVYSKIKEMIIGEVDLSGY